MLKNWGKWGLPFVTSLLSPVFTQIFELNLLPSSQNYMSIAETGSFVGSMVGLYIYAFGANLPRKGIKSTTKHVVVLLFVFILILSISTTSLMNEIMRLLSYNTLWQSVIENLILLPMFFLSYSFVAIIIFNCFNVLFQRFEGK